MLVSTSCADAVSRYLAQKAECAGAGLRSVDESIQAVATNQWPLDLEQKKD